MRTKWTVVRSPVSTFGRRCSLNLTLVGEADAHPNVSFRAVDAEAIARVLATVPIFRALTDAERADLVTHLRPRRFARDEVNRALADLAQGAIAIGRRHISVKDPALLRKHVRY